MKKLVLLSILALMLVPPALALSDGMSGMDMRGMDMSSSAPASFDKTVVRVEASKVCMVNNNYMGTTQIPVKVNGRTYYGCCAGCKITLETKPESRQAVDPVSGKMVDKAVAVIGKTAAGRVVYFSSLAHLNAYKHSTIQ